MSNLYQLMPVYARMLDDGRILEHICESLQPEYDTISRIIENLDFLVDPQTMQDEWFDYWQQAFGAGPIGQHWLGLAMNPDWPPAAKARFLERIWFYWQVKGSEQGIREGIALWTLWLDAYAERLQILHPFGKTSTAQPPGWINWGDRYDAHFTQTWLERQRLGNGNYPQLYQPPHREASGAKLPLPADLARVENLVRADPRPDRGSSSGPGQPYLHFDLLPADWAKIFPSIFTLLPELYGMDAYPVIFGWLDLGAVDSLPLARDLMSGIPDRLKTLDIDGIGFGDLWPSILESDSSDCMPLHPFTLDDRPLRLCNVAGLWTRFEIVGTESDVVAPPETETLLKSYPVLRRMSEASSWLLQLELDDSVVVLQPAVIFWIYPDGSRSTALTLSDPMPKLHLEFLLKLDSDDHLRAADLKLAETLDTSLLEGISTRTLQAKISEIRDWFGLYSRNTAPFLINDSGLVNGATGSEFYLPIAPV